MQSQSRSLVAGVAALILMAVGSAHGQIYVDANATGPTQDGTTWCTAYRSLSAALAAAGPGGFFLVADGTYTPDPTGLADSRDATFSLPLNAQLGGGFAGCGAPNPNEIDWLAHRTILSGDLHGDDGPDFTNFGDNARHVVRATGGLANTSTSIVGVTISGGNADGSCCGEDANGGGLLASAVPILHILGCRFENNIANRGGAIFNSAGTVEVSHSVFEHNLATYEFGNGGGIYATGGALTVNNCLFTDNTAAFFGGAVNNFSNTAILNSTIAANSAGEDGGGIFSSSPLSITDSILWDNRVVKGSSTGEPAQIVNTAPGAPVVNYSCIQGLTGLLGGTGNIGDDPRFRPGPLDNYYLANGTTDPGPASPSVDTGSNTAVNLGLDQLTTSSAEDLDVGTVDMGYHHPVVGTTVVLGDFDRDGDWDLHDAAELQRCFAGVDAIVPPHCRYFDYDGDLDEDLDDFPSFHGDLTGP